MRVWSVACCAVLVVLVLLFPGLTPPAAAGWLGPVRLDTVPESYPQDLAVDGSEIRVTMSLESGATNSGTVARSSDSGETWVVEPLSARSWQWIGPFVEPRRQGGFLYVTAGYGLHATVEEPDGTLRTPVEVQGPDEYAELEALVAGPLGQFLILYTESVYDPLLFLTRNELHGRLSEDGGSSWSSMPPPLGNESGVELLATAADSDRYYLLFSRPRAANESFELVLATSSEPRNVPWNLTEPIFARAPFTPMGSMAASGGKVFVTWWDEAGWHWSSAAAPFIGFDTPSAIEFLAPDGLSVGLRLNAGPSGDLYGSWQERRSGGVVPVAARLTRNGTIGGPLMSPSITPVSWAYRILHAADSRGHFHVVWGYLLESEFWQGVGVSYARTGFPALLQVSWPTGPISAPFVLRGSSEDADHVQVRIDGGPWRNATGSFAWEFPLDPSTLAIGDHQVEVRACEEADTCSAPVPATVRVASLPLAIAAIGLVAAAVVFLVLGIRRALAAKRKK